MNAFFDMGGYALYVWPAYGLALIIMIGLIAVTLGNLRAREAELKTLQELAPGRRGRPGATAQPNKTEG